MTEPAARWIRELLLRDLEATRRLAGRLAGVLEAGDVLVLTGELGAGKTTFTQSLGEALGVEGRISSPTFVLARTHRSTVQGPDLVHVDAYRTDAEGLESLDLLSIASHSVTVAEWGRGLVEAVLAGEEGSWLDLELRHSGLSAGPGIVRDFSETEEDLLGAPRRAVLRGYGARWAEPPVL